MKKKFLGLAAGAAVVGLAAVALTSCGGNSEKQIGVTDGGKTIRIQCWNEEGRRLFNKFVSDEGKALLAKGEIMDKDTAEGALTGMHYNGIPVVWTQTPSDGGAYQQKLDTEFDAQAGKAAEDRVDLFLAEADYIIKYADDSCTYDISKLGVKVDQSQTYNYTVQAASDSKGAVKGVSFQCCPSAMIYNRTIAKEVLGTDDPATVQSKVDTWAKFDAVAEQMKAAGYYMTACDSETYRVFSNNASTAWVKKGKIQIPDSVQTWMKQAKNYVDNGYTIATGVWDGAKTATIAAEKAADQKAAFSCFGPAWYYNFCMGDSLAGDWAITTGPQSHFWGGTWILAADGTDNAKEVAGIMNDFINNETTLKYLVEDENQFTNNQAYNAKVAAGDRHNAFLGGQNDTAVFLELAKKIEFKNATVYDQYCNEKFQEYYREYLKGEVSEDTAINNFKTYLKDMFPSLK